MPFSKVAVHDHISQHAAALTACNAADMMAQEPECSNWLSEYGLSCIFHDFPPESSRPFIVNFIRRMHFAFLEYDLGRKSLLDLVQDGNGRWSPYYVALTHFEVALSQLYMALDSVRKLSKQDFFKSGDGSFEDSLKEFYNAGKHVVAASDLPIWLTDEGLECGNSKLAFEDIESFMLTMAGVVKGLCNRETAQRFLDNGTTA